MSSRPWFTSESKRPISSTRARHRAQTFIPATAPPTRHSRGGRNAGHAAFDISAKFNELELAQHGEEAEGQQSLIVGDETTVQATGVDIPRSAASFSEMGFSSGALLDNIIKRCKYVNPTAIQKYGIPVAMAGRDLMASAQTGSGKTAAFCIPIIDGILVYKQNRFMGNTTNGVGMDSVACPLALILAPTRELSCQIFEEAKKFSYQTGVKVCVAYGGAPIFHQLRNLEKGVDILVATPGRLVDIIERSKVSLSNIKYLTLDEADRMLDMGFERDVRKIVQQMGMPPPGSRQTLLFSATFPAEIQNLGSDFLSNYIFLSAGKVGSSTNLIVQKVELVNDFDKRSHLVNLLCSQMGNKFRFTSAKDVLTLIFVETKKGADSLEHWLRRSGFPCIAIHGDKVQVERERALRSFRNGQTPILVATDVAARGLDIPRVAHVINFDMPKAIDSYVHRIGRTGRAGKSGLATALFSQKNIPIAKELVELMQEAKQEIPEWLDEYAKASHNGSGSGRGPRYGGGKSGGFGYRRDYYEDCRDQNNYSNQYVDTAVAYTEPCGGSIPEAAAYDSTSGQGNSSFSADYPYTPDENAHFAASNYGCSTASGWD